MSTSVLPAKVSLSFETIRLRLARMVLPEVDHVVGIATGGIVPAAMLAEHLHKPLSFLHINFRDEANKPRYEQPVRLAAVPELLPNQRILLVDDVAVTGSTLQIAKALLSEHQVTTLVFKGRADYVLFPEIDACVNWPWKQESSPIWLNAALNYEPIEKEPTLLSFSHFTGRATKFL